MCNFGTPDELQCAASYYTVTEISQLCPWKYDYFCDLNQHMYLIQILLGSAWRVKNFNSFFNVFYAWNKSLSFPQFPCIKWFLFAYWIMFHLEWKRDPYILDTIWDFGHSDIARSAKWRMKFQMEGTRHSPFNNDKWFANRKNESLLLLHTYTLERKSQL